MLFGNSNWAVPFFPFMWSDPKFTMMPSGPSLSMQCGRRDATVHLHSKSMTLTSPYLCIEFDTPTTITVPEKKTFSFTALFEMDIEERVVMLLKSTSEEEQQLQSNSDTFAERAEFYYHKRPQLLVLLRDLYGGYITLLERCKRNESKKSLFSSDTGLGVDEMVAELVWKNVERELLLDQVGEMEQQGCVSSKMIDLLKKLLEILESERMVLLNENARLDQMVSALLEENRGLKSEVVFLKKKANELARYVVKVTEDHRTSLVSRKTEHLEEQIYGLKERRKIEYFSDEQLVTFRSETREGEMNRNLNGYGYQNAGWFQFEKLKIMKRGENGARSYGGEGVRSGGSEKKTSSSVQKWWGRMRTSSVDFLMRGGGLRRYSST